MEELKTYKLKRNGIYQVMDSIKNFFKSTAKLFKKKEKKKDDDIGFEKY